ncbi:MAG: HRDC domain-containing protein [Myxococcota bacterium]
MTEAPPLPPPRWVDDEAGLAALIAQLRTQPRFAIDTESNSLHAYTERVCLVQISIPGVDAIVDPLAVDLGPLGELIASPTIQKVLHGADYDVMCFKRGYGFAFANLYDTMLAERVLGRSKYGLGSLLAEHFGFKADKKMQRFDWGRRPLPQHAVDYARFDTHFLLELADMQLQALKDADRLEDHAHACLRQAQVEPKHRPFDPTSFWKVKGARKLAEPGPAVLYELFVLRDELARAFDRPHFRIASDATLLELARVRPVDRGALGKTLDRVRGVHPRVRRQYAPRLLEAIERGIAGGPPPPPQRAPSPPRDVVERFDALRGWRKSEAEARGVEPDIVLGKNTLMEIAEAAPRSLETLGASALLDDWELSRYGAGLVACLAKHGGKHGAV